MKKLLLTLLFLLLACSQAFTAPGPSQWSLAGIASWAQPLTASGTALPATTTYAVGDLFAVYGGAASETFDLYRLTASGTDAVWLPIGGAGGGSFAILDASDLPSVTGNGNKALTLGTDTTSLYWAASGGGDPGTAASLTEHINDTASPHGDDQMIGNIGLYGSIGLVFGVYNLNLDPGYAIIAEMPYNQASAPLQVGQVVVASYSTAFIEFFPFPVVAGASSTQFIGVVYDTYNDETAYVAKSGDCAMVVADDSDPILSGDWLITSDTTPGAVMRASVSGDLPLSAEEYQRAVGICIIPPYYDSYYNATHTWAILKTR